MYIYLKLWKPGWQPNFLCDFSQLLLSNISLFTVLFTLISVFLFVFLFVWVFCFFLVRDLCRNGCRHNYSPPPPPPIPPRPYVFALTHNSLFNTSDSYSKSVRALKLVSVPLSSVRLDIGHLSKVSRRASCKALRWDKIITIGRVCIV